MHPSGDQPGGDEEIEQPRAPHRRPGDGVAGSGMPGKRSTLASRAGGPAGRRSVRASGAAGVAGALGLGHGDDEALAVVEGQPGFPVGVGQRWPSASRKAATGSLSAKLGWALRIAATEGAWVIAPVMSPTR